MNFGILKGIKNVFCRKKSYSKLRHLAKVRKELYYSAKNKTISHLEWKELFKKNFKVRRDHVVLGKYGQLDIEYILISNEQEDYLGWKKFFKKITTKDPYG